MPDKRKQGASTELDNTPASPKRVRRQVSYADLEDEDLGEVNRSHNTRDEDENEYEEEQGEEEVETKSDQPRQSPTRHPRSHPVYGQKSAFPGLDDLDDPGELFYGPAEDGLEYLRMVRSEANSLPTLFVAQKFTKEATSAEFSAGDRRSSHTEDVLHIKEQRQKEETVVFGQGSYVDGVYIAPPAPIDGVLSEDKPLKDEENVQSSYHDLLRHRFLLLRSTLRCSPPADTIAALGHDRPITLPYHIKEARTSWRWILLTADPHVVQLACMDMDSVIGVLKIVGQVMSESLRSEEVTLVRRIGAWAWGLLGKCREIGQLSSEEVAEVRILGKRAVKIMEKMNKAASLAHVEGDDGSVSGSEEETDVKMVKPADQPAEQIAENIHEPPKAQQSGAIDGATVDEVSSRAAPPVEQYSPMEVDEEQDLELAKIRLQSRLSASLEAEEEKGQATAGRRRNTSSPESGECTEEDGEDQNEVEEDDAQSKNGPETRDKQVRATLDMIITIVGEFYGQRDLLKQRDVWI